MSYDKIVVGGGLAGVISAGKSAYDGQKTVLIEQDNALLKNIDYLDNSPFSNNAKRLQFQHNIFAGKGRCELPLKHLSTRKLELLLEGWGVAFEDREGSLFLKKGSKSLKDALLNWLTLLDVTILLNSEVETVDSEGGSVTGVTISDGEKIIANKVVVATGGSINSEKPYNLAKNIGHTISKRYSTSTALMLDNRDNYSRLEDISFRNCRLYLWSGKKKVVHTEGELFFTNGKIDGSAVRNISRYIVDMIQKEKDFRVTIDTIPKIDEGDLEKEFTTSFSQNSGEPIISTIMNYTDSRDIADFLITNICKYREDIKGGAISKNMRKELRASLKMWELPIKELEILDREESVAGGLSLDELEEDTFESYICRGLYFAGDILDIDAKIGGYHTHLAFAIGRLVGEF